MAIRVNLQGQIHLPEDARISIFDRQFLYGDGIYETMRTFGGKLFVEGAHFRRLLRSAAGIGIVLPWSIEALRGEIERTLTDAGNLESTVRVIVTRGEGEFGLDPTGADQPNWVLIVRPLSPVDAAMVAEGVEVAIPSIRRTSTKALASHIKSGNYLNQAMALSEGRKVGAYEVVMLDDAGNVTEGSTSNMFFVRGGRLFTPSVAAGVLPGVTRALVLGLAAQLGIPSERGLYPASDMLTADEAFLTATIKEILPIRACDGQAIGAGVPGPVTRRLIEAYRGITRRASAGELPDREVEALITAGEEQR